MCGSPAIDFGYRDPGLLHQAKPTGLQPGLTYYYMCGDEEFGWSQEFQFSAACPADPSATVRVSAFGGTLLTLGVHAQEGYSTCLVYLCVCLSVQPFAPIFDDRAF